MLAQKTVHGFDMSVHLSIKVVGLYCQFRLMVFPSHGMRLMLLVGHCLLEII